MRTPLPLAAAAYILFASTLMIGCSDTAPVKQTEPQSIQEIAKQAMNSTGKLSREQVNALIRANAGCRPDNKH